MKRVIVGAILCLLCSTLLFAQAPDTLWTRTYGGSDTETGWSVQQTTDGGYIIAGHTKSFGAGGHDVYLIKTDANGDTLWTRTYGGTGAERSYSVQQTKDGGYVIAGYTTSTLFDLADVYLIKTDANGDTLWTRTYGDTYYVDSGRSVQQTTDGGYIIAGHTFYTSGGSNSDIYLIKTDTSGNTLWTRTYGGSGAEYSESVQQTTDGGYIIAGYTNSFGADIYDVYLIKTDTSGNTLWTRTYGGNPFNMGLSVLQTIDSGYVIAGYTNSFGADGFDVYFIKADANGDTLWTRTYGGSNNDYGHSVHKSTDGGYVIAGCTKSFGAGGLDVYLIKTDANGDTLWTRTYGGSGAETGWSVQQTTDGGYIIAGYTNSFGAGDLDVWLIRIEAELPSFAVTPTSIDFGQICVDSSKTDSVTVTNMGIATLDITSVVSDNAEFTVTPTTGSLDPTQSMQFYITFAPIDPGVETGNIIFTHNAATSPDTVTVVGNGVVGIEESKDDVISVVYALSQNYPNPFRTMTGIRYQLPKSGNVTIAIYNVFGQRIKTLVNEPKDVGYYTVHWDGRSQDGKQVSNGVYFCRMIAGEYTSVKKILLMH
jgi:hypothetical protein